MIDVAVREATMPCEPSVVLSDDVARDHAVGGAEGRGRVGQDGRGLGRDDLVGVAGLEEVVGAAGEAGGSRVIDVAVREATMPCEPSVVLSTMSPATTPLAAPKVAVGSVRTVADSAATTW